MVFSQSGAGRFGSISYTGRRATDPPGMLQASALLKAGVYLCVLKTLSELMA